MMKAKISTNKGIIEENFAPFHVNIFATELSDLSEKIAMDKVRTAILSLHIWVRLPLFYWYMYNLLMVLPLGQAQVLVQIQNFFPGEWVTSHAIFSWESILYYGLTLSNLQLEVCIKIGKYIFIFYQA